MKVVPSPNLLSRAIMPLCRSTIFLMIERPRLCLPLHAYALYQLCKSAQRRGDHCKQPVRAWVRQAKEKIERISKLQVRELNFMDDRWLKIEKCQNHFSDCKRISSDSTQLNYLFIPSPERVPSFSQAEQPLIFFLKPAITPYPPNRRLSRLPAGTR